MSIRPVKRIVEAKPTMEGAGVKLHRAFGFGDTGEFDPFLLFDDFRNDRPGDYQAGFPWHPHRGIETITYVLAGAVDHGDSLGNQGSLGAGDVQWMTAGSGIMHQEMPKGDPQGRMHGFQLWANLPAAHKMTAPRYQDVPAGAFPGSCHPVRPLRRRRGSIGARSGRIRWSGSSRHGIARSGHGPTRAVHEVGAADRDQAPHERDRMHRLAAQHQPEHDRHARDEVRRR
jgi:redox-sensitive bicupin YhaK (pirin superfamily)